MDLSETRVINVFNITEGHFSTWFITVSASTYVLSGDNGEFKYLVASSPAIIFPYIVSQFQGAVGGNSSTKPIESPNS